MWSPEPVPGMLTRCGACGAELRWIYPFNCIDWAPDCVTRCVECQKENVR
jgi:hypothetical protein